MAADKIRKTLDDISAATEAQLSGVKDHIHFTLQQAYFKCAYECFDRTKSQEEIDNCVEYCSVPVLKAQYLMEDETANLAEKMRRALMVCQDKFIGAEEKGDDALRAMESCLEVSVQHFSKTLPHIVRELKTSLGIESND
ncbi:unnamed protein product [Cuscuta europaea]|uniref:Uncharacterized protein n=1 Tax=Cuscuta europaea TaxID=41803 RepID=A0A9P1EMI3_CUSEU|nr:unnamed protein product [Cuscuta europaea]